MLLVPSLRLAALVVGLVAVTGAFGAVAAQAAPDLVGHLACPDLAAHQPTPAAVFGLLWL